MWEKNKIVYGDMEQATLHTAYASGGPGVALAPTKISLLRAVWCDRAAEDKDARAIADVAGSEEIQSEHLAEALQDRQKILAG